MINETSYFRYVRLVIVCMRKQLQVNGISCLPNELKDCKFFSITNSQGSYLRVVRCPNSQTSTTSTVSKNNTQTVVIIDGVKYEKVEQQ